jgi:hypothetical protein
MLRRLLMLLVAGSLIWVGVRVWQANRELAGPQVPDAWRALAERDAVLAEALDLFERLNRLAEDTAPAQRRTLRAQIHQSLEGLAGLVEVRLDLEDYLGRARDGDGLDALRARVGHLAEGAEHALEGLREVYKELLTAFDQQTDGGEAAVAYTRTVIDELRAQAAAESEVRAWLAERS